MYQCIYVLYLLSYSSINIRGTQKKRNMFHIVLHVYDKYNWNKSLVKKLTMFDKEKFLKRLTSSMTLKRFKLKSPINHLESWLTELIVLPSNGWQLRFPNHCINMYQILDAGHDSFNTHKMFLRKILIDPFCQWKTWKLSQHKWLGEILCLVKDHSCSTLSALLAGVDMCPAGGGRSSLALGLYQLYAGSLFHV